MAATQYVEMDPAPAKPRSKLRQLLTSLTFWIVVGTLAGILLGYVAPEFSNAASPMSNIFLRPIQFVVFPLVFSSLVVGIAGQGDLGQLGRLAIKSFIYFEIATTIALIIGLLAANIVKPGTVGGLVKKGNFTAGPSNPFTFNTFINHLTPKTWGEMMGGSGTTELLQVLIAAILVGIATAKTHGPHKKAILDLSTAVMEMMFKFVDIVIWTAPLGVCFAIAAAIGQNGISALASLGVLVVTCFVTLIIFVAVVFVPVLWFCRIGFMEFVKAMQEPLLIGFTTATSEAALPKVFEALLHFGVSPHISSFVVPFGYSFNLDGSTLYLALAAVFCAQAAGIEKSIGEQITMLLMLMISSKGVAGVRSASIIVLSATVEQFNIPSWPVALIVGADWIMNMARCFVNVFGNCLAATLMAKLEGEFRVEGWEKNLEASASNDQEDHDDDVKKADALEAGH